LAILRRLAFVVLLLALMLLAAVFAHSNPQPIDVDVGLFRIEQVPMAIVFAVVLAIGWLFGLLSASMALWRSANERRRLRQDLRYTEAELNAARQAVIPDAH
jgi:uncharacterized membrane protein YciS (DUF1049 family)